MVKTLKTTTYHSTKPLLFSISDTPVTVFAYNTLAVTIMFLSVTSFSSKVVLDLYRKYK